MQASVALRKAWQSRHCDDYTSGDRLTVNRTRNLIFDIGFHSGDDTLFFLERGHDVVAVDANPSMIQDGLRRPAMRLAERVGRLRAIATGVVNVASNQSMKFYLHRRVTEWSTFKTPPALKLSEFDPINVPVTTCRDLIQTYGVPYYMKVDIEGLDAACVQSIESDHLPLYISTEDPLQLEHLLALGYRSFKMVSQARARRGQRQFSGGMPEESPGPWVDAAGIRAHPFFSIAHMHVRIDDKGNRIREEHDLHARLASPDGDTTNIPKYRHSLHNDSFYSSQDNPPYVS